MKKIPYKTNQNHPQIKAYKEAVEKGGKSQHVIYRDKEWIVKRADSKKASQIFNTQKEATRYAREIAQGQGTALFIHEVSGIISETINYGSK